MLDFFLLDAFFLLDLYLSQQNLKKISLKIDIPAALMYCIKIFVFSFKFKRLLSDLFMPILANIIFPIKIQYQYDL